MLVHHLAAALLLFGSACNSYHRVGVVFVLITDLSDPLLEGAKVIQYMGGQKIADVLFTIFAVLFIVLRDIIFPYVITFPAFSESWDYPGTNVLRKLVVLLQAIFLYWTYIILAIAWRLVIGKGAEDIRDNE